jgi:predicted ATPase
MPDRRLRRIEVENFKRFDQLALDLEWFNLLVGPNNSGKSTLLQACSLFDSCYRSSLEKERPNGKVRFVNRTFGPEEFAVVPAAHPLDLWTNRRAQQKKNSIPLCVTAEFASGERYSFEVSFRYNRFSIQADKRNPPPIDPAEFGVVFIPGHTGFWPREERRTPAVIRGMRDQGQYGAVIRNLLLDLREDKAQWSDFRALLTEIFPDVALHDPEFDEQVDRFIKATYGPAATEPQARGRPVAFDLFSAGAGFHQFVQIFGGIFSERATTILLDEPDAHLFSRLQARLHDLLMKLVGQGRQVIAASHSPELIAAARPGSIITFTNGQPRRLQVRTDVSGVAAALGALENLGLLLIDAYERVVVLEDRSDEIYLRAWLKKVLLPQRWKLLEGRLVFLHSHGRPAADTVQVMLETVRRAFSEARNIDVQALVVADRDYRLDDELKEEADRLRGAQYRNQRWHVWKRAEIENYLLDPAPLRRCITNRLAATLDSVPLFRPPESEIEQLIDQAIEASRDPARKRLMDAFSRAERKLAASTALDRAENHLARVWTASGRVEWADAKDVVLPRLRGELQTRWKVSLPDRDIIDCFTEDEVPADMRRVCDMLAAFILREPPTLDNAS